MSYQEVKVEIFEDMEVQMDFNIIVPKWHIGDYPIAARKKT